MTMMKLFSTKAGWVRVSLIACFGWLFVAAMPGCNTTEGVGKDVKSLGKGIEETAQENKD